MADASPTLRVVMAGGGTGGHLSPGIAVAEELRDGVGAAVTFLTTGRGVEERILHDCGFPTQIVPSASPAGSLLHKAGFAWKTARGYLRSRRALKTLSPHILVALGGFGAFPPALAARSAGVPIVALEQNAIPGKVNRFLSRWAQMVFCHWPLEKFPLHPGCPQIVIGNPTRRQIREGFRLPTLAWLGLHPARRTILVMGGSQGAAALNRFVADYQHKIASYKDHVQVVLLTGSDLYTEFAHRLAGSPNVRVLSFSHKMGDLLAAADLVVCRAGATTIAECTALGKPMVLVPYPLAADGHQHANARLMVEAGAALSYPEEALGESVWEVVLESVLLTSWHLVDLATSSRLAGHPTAAREVAREVLTIAQSLNADLAPISPRWASSGRLRMAPGAMSSAFISPEDYDSKRFVA